MRRLTVPAQALIAIVVAGGAACLLLRVPDLSRWGGQDVVAFLFLTAGILLTEQFQVPLRFGRENLNFSLTEATWVGALVLARPSVVTMAVAAGVGLAQATHRRALHKAAFNVGQFLVALSVAQLLVGSLRAPGVLRPMTFLAVGLGMAAYAAINAGLIALIISLAAGKTFGSVLFPPLPENVLHFAANTALGVAALVMWHAAPGAVAVLVLPLALSYVAYRSLLGRFVGPVGAVSPAHESVLQGSV